MPLASRLRPTTSVLMILLLGSALYADESSKSTPPTAFPEKAIPAEVAVIAKWPAELHVDGRHLRQPDGKEVWLQGVNVGSLETRARGEHILESFLVAIDQWKSNVIRLPVKESYWFGRDASQHDGGLAYRKLVDEAVMLAANRGAYVVLDLHRFQAPKAEHVEFWRDAAAHFKNHPAVLFDIFNEPHTVSWEVWRNGGFVSTRTTKADEDAFLPAAEKAKAKEGFESPGMQALVNAIRETGAKNLIVAGGLEWSADLSGVLNGQALEEKGGNGIMYSWHIYNWHKNWESRILAVAEKYPILVGEVGADVKKMGFLPAEIQEDPYTWAPDMIGFIQKHHLNWTAWCFHPRATPVLLQDWSYEPSPFWGAFVKQALSGRQFPSTHVR